jgi:CheY-like chemotaxis protein
MVVEPLVLLVEEDEGVARLLDIDLSLSGFRMAHAGSPAEAVPAIDRLRPDAVVLDALSPSLRALNPIAGWPRVADAGPCGRRLEARHRALAGLRTGGRRLPPEATRARYSCEQPLPARGAESQRAGALAPHAPERRRGLGKSRRGEGTLSAQSGGKASRSRANLAVILDPDRPGSAWRGKPSGRED